MEQTVLAVREVAVVEHVASEPTPSLDSILSQRAAIQVGFVSNQAWQLANDFTVPCHM